MTTQDNKHETFGFTLIIIGIAGLIGTVFFSQLLPQESGGSLPAISFLVLMIGFSFCFPSMLQESAGQMSTMRIIVFSVTMVFCIIYIKLAWNISSIENMKIDQKWIYILGLAFGSKAFQKFGEEDNDQDNKTGGKQHTSGTIGTPEKK